MLHSVRLITEKSGKIVFNLERLSIENFQKIKDANIGYLLEKIVYE